MGQFYIDAHLLKIQSKIKCNQLDETFFTVKKVLPTNNVSTYFSSQHVPHVSSHIYILIHYHTTIQLYRFSMSPAGKCPLIYMYR